MTLLGTNTGDQTSISGIAGTKAQFDAAVTDGNFLYVGDVAGNATHTGDATGSGALVVVALNGTNLAGLATGILKNTTATGVPSIAVNSDLPVMSATVGGAVPTPPNNTTTFLRGDGTFAAPPGGGANAGQAEIDFGAFPGASDTSLAITGQAAILTTAKVRATVTAKATTDHSADEHWVESLTVMAGNISAGVGFTIYARNGNQVSAPTGVLRGSSAGSDGTRLYGKFTINWDWAA